MATLESHNHIVGDIERGVKIYNGGGLKIWQDDTAYYRATVPHKGVDYKSIAVTFSKDGRDLGDFYCNCVARDNPSVLCRHVVAAVLAIQGGVVQSNLTIGKSVAVSTRVAENNTAKTVGSGSLDVFATPMLIALIERAACECLSDCLEMDQTSVGTEINVSHTAASPCGAEITATAAIEYVFGRKVEFKVSANDGVGEIANGRHIRVIVEPEKFMKKAEKRILR